MNALRALIWRAWVPEDACGTLTMVGEGGMMQRNSRCDGIQGVEKKSTGLKLLG
jgi:hypothetical protein